MVAYLEKSDDNTKFHQIVDFLSSCSITYALTLSPTIYASSIEQFWNTTSSKTVNFVKQIHAIVNGKAVVISESLVTNLREIFIDTYETPCYTKKVFSNMARKSVHFSGNVTPLFDTMLVQHQAPEGEGIDTGGSPRRQEIMGGTFAQTMSERVLEQPNEPPLTEDEEGPSVHIEDSPKQGRIIKEMDRDENINLVSEQGEVQETAKHSRDDDDDETLAETLLNIKRSSAKETKEEAKAQGDSDKEVEELKLYMIIIPKEDIAIEAIPLAIKPLVIIKYKIVKEGKISTYHITRANGSTKRYTSMINLLENIDREDLETLWKLVKDKYGNTRPGEGYERVLWEDLKVMFEPDIESEIQKSAHLPAAG
nr:hypothetical protein [Tanacetum cinerariifolium]